LKASEVLASLGYNGERADLFIDDHEQLRELSIHEANTWIGRRSMIMLGCTIGDGSIVGAGAIGTGDVEWSSVCVGVPARIVKRNISWSRTRTISNEEMTLFRSLT